MGGEPTLHPEFERFTKYLCSKFKKIDERENFLIKPTKRFIEKRRLMDRQFYQTYHYKYQEGINRRTHGPSLWSSLGSGYYKHYELIQDSFQFQCLNDHNIDSYHSPILASRKDMGVPDKEWEILRDRCWIQNVWSCSITPKGCFFCEVAATLDWFFDGPGGWTIEPEWWKRKPEDFGDQLNWCELCGFALQDMPARDANDGIDDVTETLYEMLKKAGSKKIDAGLINVIHKDDHMGDVTNRKQVYTNSSIDRLTKENRYMYFSDVFVVMIQRKNDTADDIIRCYKDNFKGSMIENKVFICSDDSLKDELQKKEELSKIVNYVKKGICFGDSLNKIHKVVGDFSKCLLLTPGVSKVTDFINSLKDYVVNPGAIHYITSELDCESVISFDSNDADIGFVTLYNSGSSTITNLGKDRVAKLNDYSDFISSYPEYKRVIIDKNIFDEGMDFDTIINDKRYAVYGAGELGTKAYELVKKAYSSVSFYVDGDERKQGSKLLDKEIISPTDLINRSEQYDMILIATDAVNDVRNTLIKLGVHKDCIAPVI